jgi:hypothetical protein
MYADADNVWRDLEHSRALRAEAAEVQAETAQLVRASQELGKQARQHRADLKVLRDSHAELAADAKQLISQ